MQSPFSYSTLSTQQNHDDGSESGSSSVCDFETADGNQSTTGASVAASPYWSVPFAKPASTTGFSPFVAFCFTINYILGTGFLTIPWAFVQSGLGLSAVLLILSAVASDIAKDFMLETMARAEVMLDDEMHWINRKGNDRDKNSSMMNKERVLLVPPKRLQRERELLFAQKNQKSDYDAIDNVEDGDGNREDKNGKEDFHRSSSLPLFAVMEMQGSNNHSTMNDNHDSKAAASGIIHLPQQVVTLRQKAPPKYVVQERKFEVNALCRVFLGKRGLRMYTTIICLYICGALWAYTSVFSSAMAAALPLFGDGDESSNYLCYAILFGCVVVPLSCLELDEQVPLQVVLTGCRFVMFFIMIGTSHLCVEDMRVAGLAISAAGDGATAANSPSSYDEANYFRPSGLAKTLPILIFANIFHHSIPGLTHPVADKKKIGKVFSSTNAFTVAAYLTLGLTLGSAFGTSIEQSSNLNWSNFHAGTGYIDEYGNVVGAAFWTKIVSSYIMLFPAVDVVSAYPLNAITLGNNLLGAVYGKRIHEVEKDRLLRTAFRLLASVPPIIFGILVRELGVITDYTGTTGFLIGLCFPAILYVSSKAIAASRNFATDTYYTSYGSTTLVAQSMLWFGIFMTVAVFVTLTFGHLL